MNRIRPTELICRAAGLEPIRADSATQPGRCAMCGTEHIVGEPVAPFLPGDSFTDYANLLAPNSDLMCGWCAATWSQDFTQRYIKSVVSLEGVFPCASNDHIAHWVLNPPSGPFMMFLGDQKRQHVVWRTPVNYSQELIVFRFGEQLMTIRPNVLRQVADEVRNLVDTVNKRSKKKRKSPFLSLSRDIDSQQHGQIQSDILALAEEDPEICRGVDAIHQLSPGELWALTAVLYAKEPGCPAKIDFSEHN